MPQSITVHTRPPYPVLIGPGLLFEAGALLRPLLGEARLLVVTDSNVAPLYLEAVMDGLGKAGFEASSWVFPAGEAQKNLRTLEELLGVLAREELGRGDVVLALGGGVSGDLAGLAAALYLRGIRCVQLPTTLLAAVDASVGGKTAVDLPAGKNLVGAFLQPTAVLCDTKTLRTLPPKVFAAGAAEAVKTGVLAGEALFSALEAGQLQASPQNIIESCVRYKAEVVERDEQDRGERQILNLGHTAGHAIERCSQYAISHGEAVAMGLALIARASARRGWCEKATAERICRLLCAQELPTRCPYSAQALARAALHDKKRQGEAITLLIPAAIGSCQRKSLPLGDLEGLFFAGMED